MMKNCSIFAASSPKTILLVFVCVAIFIATNTALYAAETGLPIHNSCCALKPVIVFGEMWKGSLSSFKYFSFSFMPKTMKDYGDAKHSNIAVTPTERNAVSIEAFNIEENAKLPALSLSDYPAEIQSVLSFLVANKTPVTLVFNITNNNMQIGDSQASNICLITGHDNSSISGRENTISKI